MHYRPYSPHSFTFDLWRDDAEIDMLRDDMAEALGYRPGDALALRDVQRLGDADMWEPPPEPGERGRARLSGNRRNARHVRAAMHAAQQRKA